MVPSLQEIRKHKVLDSVVRMNGNDRGAQGSMVQVTEEMRLLGYNNASLSECSIDVLDKVELVKSCLFVGSVIETNLLKAEFIALRGTNTKEFCWSPFHVQKNIVILEYNWEENKKGRGNKEKEDANHQHGTRS